VKRESEIAVAHHWRFSVTTAWIWRTVLGVTRNTPGTAELNRAWFPERRDEAAMERLRASLRSPARAAKIAPAKHGKPRPVVLSFDRNTGK
jgi:hypothetical protein